MKKGVIVLLLIVLAIFISSFTGCEADHEHSYGEWLIEKAATCTETGIKSRTCDCGEKETSEIPALGHNFVDGLCTECGATEEH